MGQERERGKVADWHGVKNHLESSLLEEENIVRSQCSHAGDAGDEAGRE